MLGNGWFSGLEIFGGTSRWGEQPQAILEVAVTYDDGTQQLFFTEDSWKAAAGPIGRNLKRGWGDFAATLPLC
jgi:alpha-L-rhamnosidase